MNIKAVRSKATDERFLKIEEGNRKQYLSFGLAALCVDKRISSFRTLCTDCRESFEVRELNDGGWCETCATVGIEA